MRESRRRFILLWGCLALATASIVRAHPSPSQMVVALSERIDAGERTASLLARRGDEYRALGDLDNAIADYHAALLLKSQYARALYGLAHAYLDRRQYSEAANLADQAIAAAHGADQAAPFHAVLARILERRRQWQASAQQWKCALASSRPQVDWYLGEARALNAEGLHDEARQSLESAIERNSSVVLRRAWLDALIRCGKTFEAAEQIDAGLARARWKSSWLIMRAQLSLKQKRFQMAKRDAEEALREIDARIHPGAPNPFLTAARVNAEAVLAKIARQP